MVHKVSFRRLTVKTILFKTFDVFSIEHMLLTAHFCGKFKMELYSFTCFFLSNTFIQVSLSVAYLSHKLSFKCCLGVAYYI